jgi:hypothetical protein
LVTAFVSGQKTIRLAAEAAGGWWHFSLYLSIFPTSLFGISGAAKRPGAPA